MHILPPILTTEKLMYPHFSKTHKFNFEHTDNYYIEDESDFIKHDNLN